MKPGEKILVKALKSDGHAYRWWHATIEAIGEAWITTMNPAGHSVEGPDGIWESEYAIRSYYWFGKSYNLLEVYRADGSLEQVYIHIASPPVLEDDHLNYTDWELDVVRYPGKKALLIDEDEFELAAQTYNYSPEFRQACYSAAHEAIELANDWPVNVFDEHAMD